MSTNSFLNFPSEEQARKAMDDDIYKAIFKDGNAAILTEKMYLKYFSDEVRRESVVSCEKIDRKNLMIREQNGWHTVC